MLSAHRGFCRVVQVLIHIHQEEWNIVLAWLVVPYLFTSIRSGPISCCRGSTKSTEQLSLVLGATNDNVPCSPGVVDHIASDTGRSAVLAQRQQACTDLSRIAAW